MKTIDTLQNPQPFYGWRMAMLACIAQNLAVGTIFGSFGVLLVPVSETFNASVSSAAFALSLVILVMGIGSPLIGKYLDRYSIRRFMQAGALLMAIGFIGASQAPSLLVFHGCFVLIGLGSTMMGSLPAATLVNRWFIAGRGKALGVTSLPILVMVTPLASNQLIEATGWRQTLFLLSVVLFAAIAILQFIIDKPENVDQQALGSVPANDTPSEVETDHHEQKQTPSQLGITTLLRNRQFLLIAMSMGFSSGSITLTAHIANHTTSLGFSAQQGALLLTIVGFASMIGTVGLGTLADKMGERNTMLFMLIAQMIMWALLIIIQLYAPLILLVSLLAIFTGGMFPVLSALFARVFGPYNLGVTLGTVAIIALPFNFVASPVAGWFFDQHGDYRIAFAVHAVMYVFAALFIYLVKNKR